MLAQESTWLVPLNKENIAGSESMNMNTLFEVVYTINIKLAPHKFVMGFVEALWESALHPT
jgi:hypothetical protein